jgi:hypothetical protein
MFSESYSYVRPDGKRVEFRRHFARAGILDLQARVTQDDGTPYSDEWFPVSDEGLSILQTQATDILDKLHPRTEGK